MAHDVVINGTTYPAVASVAMKDENGNVNMYYPDAVRYVEQTLTDAQKAQARANIGAVAVSAVQAAANAALQEAKPGFVQAVLDALGGTPVFGVVDADKNIILSGNLAEGVYTLKYEDADGNVTEIGTLNHSNAPEVTYTNLFVPGTASLNTRMSGSSSTSKAQDGYVMTAEIQLPEPVTVTGTYDESVPFVLVPDAMWASSANIFGRVANGDLNMFMDAGSTPGATVGAWRKIHLRNQFTASAVSVSSIIVSLYVKGSAISASDIQNIEIYYNEIPE